MKLFDTIAAMGHEQLVICSDSSSGYRGIIAIHSTTLGPALGGTRFWNYATDEEAIIDALRLARGMTYKNAVAGLNLGGGKSVIIGDNKTTRPRDDLPRPRPLRRDPRRPLHHRRGRRHEHGRHGLRPHGDRLRRRARRHARATRRRSPRTASSAPIQASAKERWGSDDLDGQDGRDPGLRPRRLLSREGAARGGREAHRHRHRRRAREARRERVRRARGRRRTRSTACRPTSSRPARWAAIINDKTIPQLKVEIVAGAANNVLLEERHGDVLEEKGILYAPDYVANAGGVINVYCELAGWSSARAFRKADEIYDTILKVFEIAKTDKVPTYVAADRLAEQRIAAVGSMVRTWPQWPNKYEREA